MTEGCRVTMHCRAPLPDGSDCHGCRIHRALIDAEMVVERKAVEAGYLHIDRCLRALGDATAHFLAEIDDDDSLGLLSRIYFLSRKYRKAHEVKGTA